MAMSFTDWLRSELSINSPNWGKGMSYGDKKVHNENLARRFEKNPNDSRILDGLDHQEYRKWLSENSASKPSRPYGGNYGGGGSSYSSWSQIQAMREAEAKRKEQEENARKLAYINDQIGYMPGQLDRINRAERNRLDFIDDNYNSALGYSDRAWRRAQEDHKEDVARRLRVRTNRVNSANEDFRRQNDAFARYFNRVGAGSSSVAQITAPTLLARGASKIRNEIEEANAEQDQLQTKYFNRAKEDHEYNLMELARQRAMQRQAAQADFNDKRSNYYRNLSELERQRASYQGKDYNTVIAESRASRDRAAKLADSAVDAGRMTPEMKFRAVRYTPVPENDWQLERMKSRTEGEANMLSEQDDAYNRYFRDEEERKKREREAMIKM